MNQRDQMTNFHDAIKRGIHFGDEVLMAQCLRWISLRNDCTKLSNNHPFANWIVFMYEEYKTMM